mgnify:CR=1 FL=1
MQHRYYTTLPSSAHGDTLPLSTPLSHDATATTFRFCGLGLVLCCTPTQPHYTSW